MNVHYTPASNFEKSLEVKGETKIDEVVSLETLLSSNFGKLKEVSS